MTSTYSYTITNKNDNSIFLSGFFNVTNSLIIDFYDYSQIIKIFLLTIS